MRFFLYSLFISIFLLFTVAVTAQEKFSKKALKQRLEGDKLSDFGKYAEAEPFYLKAVEISKDYSTAYQRLAHVYIQQKNYKGAYDALNRIIKIGGDFPSEVYFRMAQSCYALGKFQEADDFIFQYSAVPKMTASRKQELQELKDNIAYAKEAGKKPISFNPKPLGENINTAFNEYFPSLTADEQKLYFTRHIKAQGISQEDIFVSEKDAEGNWGKSVSVSSNINTLTNEGAHSISADGRLLYFTMCEHQGGYGSCDIYVSKRVGNEWSRPENLGPEINTAHKETQPCLSADGMALYFVSSRPGGYGKLDIWMTYKKPDGKWGTPINLGPEINSEGIEERPFMHPDNQTLYFASDGRKGFGNADLFIARRHETGGKWNSAENMGFPINSFYNESGLYVTTDGSKGYFATERMNTAFNLDIIEFNMPEHLKPKKVTYTKGTIADKDTQKKLAATLSFVDLATGKMVNEIVSDAITGEYLLTLPLGKDYVVNATANGYLFFSQFFSLKNANTIEPFIQDIFLAKITAEKTIVLENVFFDTDSFQLKTESFIELNKMADFLQKNTKLKVEIGGYTDNTGNADYNLKLSEQRAKSVYEYLIAQKVPAAQLSYKGYGMENPITDNATDAGKAKNRRTEMKVISAE
jgi:outer membrane protein OmpA-like peptidoglycan-associated protein/tetratricopeptide (TPR) repeat protein